MATAAGACLLLVMGSILKSRHRQKQQLNQLGKRCRVLEQELNELHQHDDAKTNLLCVLAHDLRSPFATLKNLVWLLEQNLLEPAESSALLPRVRFQIEGLYSSLENLLLWSNKQANGRNSHVLSVPVASIAREITDMYQPVADQKQVTLKDPGPSQERALVDPDALRLILRNLLDNAIKFTPSGGTIAIAVQPCDKNVLLRIEDTGMGMNDAQLAHIFDDSPDAHTVRQGTAGEKGLGLGLQLCRNYTRRCGGQLKVISHPGQGTRFEVRLPSAGHP